jgi:Rrf2 family protein
MRLEIMRRTDIALRALRLLEQEGATLQSADLAHRLDSTTQYIPQVLNPMVRAGWISSETGPHGGYQLTTDLGRRTVLDLIELIEGPTDDGRCVLQSSQCNARRPCSLHDAWTGARAALIERLGSTVISTARETIGEERR